MALYKQRQAPGETRNAQFKLYHLLENKALTQNNILPHKMWHDGEISLFMFSIVWVIFALK